MRHDDLRGTDRAAAALLKEPTEPRLMHTLPDQRRTDPVNPPIRVAVDMSHLRPGGENGGIKPFLFETLLWLGRQQRTPLQFFYLTCASTHAEVRAQLARLEDEVICVRADGARLPSGDEQVPRERRMAPPPLDLLTRLGVDVLYCPFGSVDFETPGIGTISTIVDVLHRDYPWSLDPRHNAEREQMFQQIVAAADRLQCISHHVVSRMRVHYDVPEERLFTVYIAVHQRFAILPALEKSISVSGAPGPAPYPPSPFFFYPANSWRHKNHETLLLAYGMYRAGAVAAGTAPWPLVLTGHPDARWKEMQALAQTLGLSEKQGVHFAGYVPPHLFGRLWEEAGALVFPSLHEGFGIPLLEAMQHDLPILCSQEGSLPEVGADACLFADCRRPEALAEAMTRLATDATLRDTLIAAGRRRLRDFSLASESSHLLEAIIGLSRTPPPFRPVARGIFPDGWTERFALLAVPADPPGGPACRLTLRFHPLNVPRHVRLRLGTSVALGSFLVPAYQRHHEISVDCRPTGGALTMEIPDAANLSPADTRLHGIHLLAANLRMADGREYSLFPT